MEGIAPRSASSEATVVDSDTLARVVDAFEFCTLMQTEMRAGACRVHCGASSYGPLIQIAGSHIRDGQFTTRPRAGCLRDKSGKNPLSGKRKVEDFSGWLETKEALSPYCMLKNWSS